MHIKTFILLLLFPFFAAAQVKKKDYKAELKKLVGNWTGTLQYTDYSDDKKQVTLKTNLQITDAGDSLLLKMTYFESVTDSIISTFGMYLTGDADQLHYDGEVYNVLHIISNANRFTLRTMPDDEEKESMDNNKKAEIKKTFTIAEKGFVILKEVKYEGGKDFFVRNKYTFTR